MKRLVNIKEDPAIVEQLQRVAASEGTTLSAIYRRAARLFLATVPTSGKSPKDQPEQVAA
jgi:hypothetical protein